MPEAVVVSAVRSPIGRAVKGSLKDMRPDAAHGPVPVRSIVPEKGSPTPTPTDVDQANGGTQLVLDVAQAVSGAVGDRAAAGDSARIARLTRGSR